MEKKLLFKVMSMMMCLAIVMALGNIVFAQGHLNHETEVNTNTEKENKGTAKLQDIQTDAAKNMLSDLRGRVETEKMQPLSQGGKLSIILVNEGTEKIDFLNPLDFIRIILLDKQGQKVDLPEVAPRFLINTRKKDNDKIRLPFKFSVAINDRFLTDNEINQHSFNLLPGGHFRINIEIDQILKKQKNDKQVDTPKPREIINIPAGEYQVSVAIRIVDSNSDINRQLESRFVKIILNDTSAPLSSFQEEDAVKISPTPCNCTQGIIWLYNVSSGFQFNLAVRK